MNAGKALAAAVAALLLVAGINGPARAAEDEKLIYLALWRGCEHACRAFKAFVTESGMRARIEQRDAARDKTRLPGFVREARALNADIVVTWGTSVTRGMAGTLAQAADERYLNERPIVFMIVADPIGAGIIESYERTGRRNITGTRNRVPESVNINVIRSYQPGFKRLGMVFNANERNSVLKVEELRALGAKQGFEVVSVEVAKNAEGQPSAEAIPAAVRALHEATVDFVYVGSSSFLRKNQDVFTDAAAQHGLPTLSPYEGMVRDSHALISVAARYADVGRLAGEQVRRILVDGETPGDLAVVAVEKFAYVINMETARRVKLLPPIEVLEIAETVN
jgi:putative ABC transport system substrate-binding protein